MMPDSGSRQSDDGSAGRKGRAIIFRPPGSGSGREKFCAIFDSCETYTQPQASFIRGRRALTLLLESPTTETGKKMTDDRGLEAYMRSSCPTKPIRWRCRARQTKPIRERLQYPTISLCYPFRVTVRGFSRKTKPISRQAGRGLGNAGRGPSPLVPPAYRLLGADCAKQSQTWTRWGIWGMVHGKAYCAKQSQWDKGVARQGSAT